MKSQEVGHVQSLTRSDDCDCDECNSHATMRLTVPAENGVSFRDFCNSCYRDYQHENQRQKSA